MKITLSIIIPVYNVKNYLRKCLYSVVESAGENSQSVEVIIVDDGSTDGSGIIADSFAKCYPWFRVLHQPNGGVAHARNVGLELARGEWIYLADSDDWLTRNAVSSILNAIAEKEESDILFFDAYKHTAKKIEVWEHFSEEKVWNRGKTKEMHLLKDLQQKVLYIQGTPLAAPWDKVYRSNFLRNRGIRFQESLKVLDDMVFNMEAIGAAQRVCYIKEKIYHYRHVPDSITNSYRPDRVKQDGLVWKYIEEYMSRAFEKEGWSRGEAEAFRQSFYCRVIKSFSICCRLCFFHDKNEQNFLEKLTYVKGVMHQKPYQEAFHRVKGKNLEWRLKLVVLMTRLNTAGGIYLLHLGNRWWEGRNEG